MRPLNNKKVQKHLASIHKLHTKFNCASSDIKTILHILLDIENFT
jgi:hypothetical protein